MMSILPRPDVLQQPLQGGPLERAAGEAAVVVAVGTSRQPSCGLALDVGLAGLALRVEGVEGQVEIFVGRLAGVDRAALQFRAARCFWVNGAPVRGRGRRASICVAPRGRPRERASVAFSRASLASRCCRPKNRGPFQVVPVIGRRDAGQARVDCAVPGEAAGNDGHGMAHAIVLADEHGSGFETPDRF